MPDKMVWFSSDGRVQHMQSAQYNFFLHKGVGSILTAGGIIVMCQREFHVCGVNMRKRGKGGGGLGSLYVLETPTRKTRRDDWLAGSGNVQACKITAFIEPPYHCRPEIVVKVLTWRLG